MYHYFGIEINYWKLLARKTGYPKDSLGISGRELNRGLVSEGFEQ